MNTLAKAAQIAVGRLESLPRVEELLYLSAPVRDALSLYVWRDLVDEFATRIGVSPTGANFNYGIESWEAQARKDGNYYVVLLDILLNNAHT